MNMICNVCNKKCEKYKVYNHKDGKTYELPGPIYCFITDNGVVQFCNPECCLKYYELDKRNASTNLSIKC